MTDKNSRECECCGSTAADRLNKLTNDILNFPKEKHEAYLKPCPHCGATKCSMCDMGDDVYCISCDNGIGDD